MTGCQDTREELSEAGDDPVSLPSNNRSLWDSIQPDETPGRSLWNSAAIPACGARRLNSELIYNQSSGFDAAL